MQYLNKKHMICLDRKSFEKIYKDQRQKELIEFMTIEGISIEELTSDRSKMEEVATTLHDKLIKEKDEIEIFAALFVYLRVYPIDSEVCFVLNDRIDPRKTKIDTLEKLKSSVKENSIVDFGIMSPNIELREFQLKQYKGELNTYALASFIEKVINKYGKDLGHTNLMIILQSGGNMDSLDIVDLNKKVSQMGIKSDCEVLLSYNDSNKFNVIKSIYPDIKTNTQEISNGSDWLK